MPFDVFCRGDSLVRTAGRHRRSSRPPALTFLIQALSLFLYWSRDQRDHSLVWFHVGPCASRRVVNYKRPPEMEVEDGSLTRLNMQRGRGRVKVD